MKPIDADALKQDLLKKDFYPAIVKCALEAAPTIEQPTWINVKDRLPTVEDANEYSEVLAIDQHGKKTVCQLWQFNSSYRPMCWLPFSALPEQPKGDK